MANDNRRKYFTLGITITLVVISFLFGIFYEKSRTKEHKPEKAHVSPKDEAAESSYQKNQVKNTILKNAGSLQTCYNSYLEGEVSATDGTILIDWQIDTTGKVRKPAIVSTQFSSDSLSQCMVAAIALWDFPPPVENTYASHTFRFKRQTPASRPRP